MKFGAFGILAALVTSTALVASAGGAQALSSSAGQNVFAPGVHARSASASTTALAAGQAAVRPLAADPIPTLVITNYGPSDGPNKVLDVDAWSTNDRGKVQMWEYRLSGNVANQRWQFLPTLDGRYFQILNLNSGKCLDKSMDNGDVNGEPVYQFSCNWQALNQQWYFEQRGLWGYPVIRNAEDGRCLDIRNFDTSNGAPVQVWDCNSASRAQWNQTWIINQSYP